MLRRLVPIVMRHHSRCYSAVGNQKEPRERMRTPIAEELASLFGNYSLINKILRLNPELNDSDIYFWKTFTNVLSKFGFQPRDCIRIIGLCPSLLGYEEEKLEEALNEWSRGLCFPISDLKFLILNRPEFLTVSPGSIKVRVPYLVHYSKTKDWLMTLLFLCPNIMTDNWDEILKKLEFLHDEMAIYRSEVLTCRAMSKPLEYIKMRFSIVEKCGVYTRPSVYEHKQTHKERLKLKNPKLKDIVDKTDASFAKKIAKISLEEYEVYANLFSSVQEEETDDEPSDESDEE